MPEKNFVQKAVQKHGRERKNLIPVLQDIVKEYSYLSEKAMTEVARELDISPAEVYGVASFYSFLDTKPLGKNIIRICKTIICYMHGQDEIVKAIEEKLKIKLGDTTPDGKFSFLPTNCIGHCHKGPAMLVNDRVYSSLTPEKAVAALEEYL